MSGLAILLVCPQMGENIGAAARAMANFGVNDLRLTAPRDGWPNPKASDMAGKALPLIDDATVFETTREALTDCQYVLATTARERSMNLPVLDVREAMQELATRQARGEKCAVLFGPERTGLENEDIALADAVVTIPVSPDYASLNLAQAVVVVCYEQWMARAEGATRADVIPSVPVEQNTSAELLSHREAGALPASRAQLDGLFGQFEEALDAVNFWRVAEKKETMWRNIRAVLVRAGMTAQEVATWRGILRALREK